MHTSDKKNKFNNCQPGAPEFFSRGGQISKKGHFFVKKALQQKSIIATMSQSN